MSSNFYFDGEMEISCNNFLSDVVSCLIFECNEYFSDFYIYVFIMYHNWIVMLSKLSKWQIFFLLILSNETMND